MVWGAVRNHRELQLPGPVSLVTPGFAYKRFVYFPELGKLPSREVFFPVPGQQVQVLDWFVPLQYPATTSSHFCKTQHNGALDTPWHWHICGSVGVVEKGQFPIHVTCVGINSTWQPPSSFSIQHDTPSMVPLWVLGSIFLGQRRGIPQTRIHSEPQHVIWGLYEQGHRYERNRDTTFGAPGRSLRTERSDATSNKF